jgi:hypothetical protein
MNDRLNELRNEAKRLTEPFSPALHARVMAGVRAEAAPVRSRPPAWRYAVAAAAMIMIALGAWLLTRPAIAPPTPGSKLVFSVDNPLRGVVQPVGGQATDGNPALAYLDHDAAKLGRYVARQLDQLPPVNR